MVQLLSQKLILFSQNMKEIFNEMCVELAEEGHVVGSMGISAKDLAVFGRRAL
jgi:hypothetical protein